MDSGKIVDKSDVVVDVVDASPIDQEYFLTPKDVNSQQVTPLKFVPSSDMRRPVTSPTNSDVSAASELTFDVTSRTGDEVSSDSCDVLSPTRETATTTIDDDRSSSPTSDSNDHWFSLAERMRILMVDKATPMVLNGSEIIGSAWEGLGGEKMMHVDYLQLDFRGSTIPVPVLVPVTLFGGEIANIQKFISSHFEALNLIVEEKIKLLQQEKERLPSYLRLEDFNLEKAKELCRQQIDAAQCFVEGQKAATTDNIEWIRTMVIDSIRNQYEDWKSMGSEKTDAISELFNRTKEHAATSDVVSNACGINEALRSRANQVFANIMEDEIAQKISDFGVDAKIQWEVWATDMRRQAYEIMDFEMMSATWEFINNAKESIIEPHMRPQVIQTIVMQATIILTFMKSQIDQLISCSQYVPDPSGLVARIRKIPLFPTDGESNSNSQTVPQTSTAATEGVDESVSELNVNVEYSNAKKTL